MRIGNYELSLVRKKSELAKGASTKKPEGKVDIYSEVASKTFGQYKTADGNTSISYDIVEGLYKRTIMKRVIDKRAGDATRLGYTIAFTNEDGTPHEQATIIGKDISRKLTRNTQKGIYRDTDVYGDAFLYKQEGPSETGLSNVQDLYGVNPRDIEPKEDGGKLVGWEYQSTSKGETIDLSLEEIIHIPNDPLTGRLFGDSIFESVLQVLNLILNSQLNSAVILDRFAIPLVQWKIDSKHDRRKTPISEILGFIKRLNKLDVGSDLVTDASITHDVIGTESKVIDFSPMLDKLDNYFFATAGVPGQILGLPADNHSAITRQLQTYYESVFDFQSSVGDYLIQNLYWPEILNAGIQDLYSIDIVHNKPMVEQESRIMTWVKDALALNIINLNEGRSALGYEGAPPSESNNLEWLLGKNDDEGPEFDKKQNQEKPPGVNQKGSGKK